MSEIIELSRRPVILALAIYIALTVISIFGFNYVQQEIYAGSVDGGKYIYIIFGPALALFTHMSYILYFILSIFVFPLLLIAVIWDQIRLLFIFLFLLSWFGIGWYLYDLF